MSGASSQKPRQSRPVGPARQPNGQTTTAYEAHVAQTCGQCGATIPSGQLFSRRAIPGRSPVAHLTQAPVCTTCRPLQVEEQD